MASGPPGTPGVDARTVLERLNAGFDALPCTRFYSLVHSVPAFRSCGWLGFYLAFILELSVGVMGGRAVPVLVLLGLVSGASFFVYAHLRRWLTRREELVLLEHVWFALLCCAGVLQLLGEPVLAHLDPVAAGLAIFLACGRVGCFLVGCCHGLPAGLGVRYPHAHAEDGFPAHLTSVRLFPVQLVEALGLLLIGLTAAGCVIAASPGTALWLFLVAYAVMRFGLEALRGDARPHLFGISQSRWMALIEVGCVVLVSNRIEPRPVATLALGAAACLWIASSMWQSRLGWRARAMRPSHLESLRELAHADEVRPPRASRSTHDVQVAASHGGRVVSLSLGDARFDLPFLCRLAAAAFPELDVSSVDLGRHGVLVFERPIPSSADLAKAPQGMAEQLYARVVSAAQQRQALPHSSMPPSTQSSLPPSIQSCDGDGRDVDGTRRVLYFEPPRVASRQKS